MVSYTALASHRSELLRPLESRGVAVTELPVYGSDGPDAFHVVATAPSSVKLYLLMLRGEFTIGFGEHWHSHVPVDEVARAVELVEALVSGALAVVEWYGMKGKYTGSGPVPVSEVPAAGGATASWPSPGNGLPAAARRRYNRTTMNPAFAATAFRASIPASASRPPCYASSGCAVRRLARECVPRAT
jgi:hypothetical protein